MRPRTPDGSYASIRHGVTSEQYDRSGTLSAGTLGTSTDLCVVTISFAPAYDALPPIATNMMCDSAQ